MAVNSASASNGQPWRWIVIQGRDEVRRVSGLAVDWMRQMVVDDPAMAQAWGMAQADQRTGRPAWIGSAETPPTWSTSTATRTFISAGKTRPWPLGYLELYAPMLGLGACWVAYLYKPAVEYPPLIKALGVPETDRVYGAVLVGQSKYKYPRAPKRKAPLISWK